MAGLWCAEGDVLKMKLEEDLASHIKKFRVYFRDSRNPRKSLKED